MGLNWQVASRNTMRSYEQAARDFETVTGLSAKTADIASIAVWQASMEARGLSINTIRTRLSAVAVIAGVRVTLPKRVKPESPKPTLSREQVQALMASVTSQSDKMLLVKMLMLGTQARANIPTTFGAHWINETQELTAQQASRLLKRYAAKAGIDKRGISLRVWCLTGKKLCEVLDVKQLVELIGHSEHSSQVSWRPLHGIGRRNRSMSV